MTLTYRGQQFHLQLAPLHLMATGTLQVRTLIYRGTTFTCEVLVPTQFRRPRAVNWRYCLPQPMVVTALAPTA